MVALTVRIGRAGGFVVGADSITEKIERGVTRMMEHVPKSHDKMGVMGPLRFGKGARLEKADERVDLGFVGEMEDRWRHESHGFRQTIQVFG